MNMNDSELLREWEGKHKRRPNEGVGFHCVETGEESQYWWDWGTATPTGTLTQKTSWQANGSSETKGQECGQDLIPGLGWAGG